MAVASSSIDVDPKTCPVIDEWMKMEVVVARAGTGKIAHVSNDTDRQCVSANADLLEPLIKTYGCVAEKRSIVPQCDMSCHVKPFCF